MGACCSATTPRYRTLLIEYNQEQIIIRPVPPSISELKKTLISLQPGLADTSFSILKAGVPIESDEQLAGLYKRHSSASAQLTVHLEPSYLPRGCFWVTRESVKKVGFITNMNYLMTVSEAIPTPEAVESVECSLNLDPSKFFFRSRALKVTMVSAKVDSEAVLFPMTSIKLNIGQIVTCNLKEYQINSADHFTINYNAKAIPGTPVLLDGKLVGIHICNNKALNIQAVIKELQTVSSFHVFSTQINELLTQVVFQEPLVSAVPSKTFYTLNTSSLVSFSTGSFSIDQIDLQLPLDAGLAHVGAGLFIIGGQKDDVPQTSNLLLDTVSLKLVKKKSMNLSRYCHSIVFRRGFIYALSGITESGWTNECESYNIQKNFWLPIYPLHYSRRSCSATVYNDTIYVAGGWMPNGSLCNILEKFDGKRWVILDLKLPMHPVVMLGTHSEFIYVSDKIYRIEEKELVPFRNTDFTSQEFVAAFSGDDEIYLVNKTLEVVEIALTGNEVTIRKVA
jgi:hypothetical protein